MRCVCLFTTFTMVVSDCMIAWTGERDETHAILWLADAVDS